MARGAERAPSDADVFAQGCRRFETTRDKVRFRCADGSTKELPRSQSDEPPAMLERMRQRRRACTECTVPDFDQVRFDEPEVSFGVPFRVSP
eukprot:2115840-Rhodomonas_salina.1